MCVAEEWLKVGDDENANRCVETARKELAFATAEPRPATEPEDSVCVGGPENGAVITTFDPSQPYYVAGRGAAEYGVYRLEEFACNCGCGRSVRLMIWAGWCELPIRRDILGGPILWTQLPDGTWGGRAIRDIAAHELLPIPLEVWRSRLGEEPHRGALAATPPEAPDGGDPRVG